MSSLGIIGEDIRALGLGGFLSRNGTEAFVFVTKSIERTERCNVRLSDKEGDFGLFPIMSVADSDDFSEIEREYNSEIKIFAINVFAHRELFNSRKNWMIVSCCGENLNSTYIKFLNKSDCKGTIVVINNDKSLAEKADRELVNFTVKSAVLDMFCLEETEFNAKRSELKVFISRNSTLVFPPHCRNFKRFFRNTLESFLHITFTRSYEEYERAVNEKLINVTFPHAIMALYTYQYFNYEGIEKRRFSDIPYNDFEMLKDSCLIIHEQMCAHWLIKRGRHYRIFPRFSKRDLLEYVCIADCKINLLYYSDELVVRVINPASEVSIMKLQKLLRYVAHSSQDDKQLRNIIKHLLDD